MDSLLDKLMKMKNYSDATEEFSDLAQAFKKSVLNLKEDFFEKLDVPKVCMNQVRELVLEIEDWIDQKPESTCLDPLDIEEIENFMTEIKEARERFTWYYGLLKKAPTDPDLVHVEPCKININPGVLVEDKSFHGLLDGPRDNIVKYLTEDKEEMLKVVSLVGVEGLGKTTLAKEIYSELQIRRSFQCQVFVSVAQGTPTREILNDILRQVNPKKVSLFHDLQRIITDLREYFDKKRYFILFDGIWSTQDWKVINCALPNNRGSRVLITTCTMDVGKSCSSYPNDLVYQMEALSEEESRTLFSSRIINLQEEDKGFDFDEDCRYMLKMCGGMPLAIIVASGLLLARKSKALAELKMLRESIYSSLKQKSSSDGMKKILRMSYADLSIPLRSCFLYLTVFRENYTIKKDRLIRLWEAEGFIPRKDEEYLWETGEMFFNELISRRLIQPVFNYEDDQPVGCTIHSVILDFIRSLAREGNFAMTAAEMNSGPFPCDTIRRFSVDCIKEDETANLSTSSMHLSRMRSLTVTREVKGFFAPPAGRDFLNNLSVFKLLRVLDLEDTNNLRHWGLAGIGGLVLLRYLGLAGTSISQVPEDINKLEQLETLDLRRNGLISFSASTVKLQKLRHLLLHVDIDANHIWEMPELEVASNICAWSKSSLGMVVELLRKSERLRVLGLHLTILFPEETDLVPFLEEVVNSKLQSLSLDWDCSDAVITLLVDSWEKVTSRLEKRFEPQKFELRIRNSFCNLVTLPPNMGSLASLTHLHIMLDEAKPEDFLPHMRRFAMDSGGRFVMNKGIFPCMKVFSLRILNSWMELEFEEGAMPKLQRLARTYRASSRRNQAYPDIGIEHLTCLTRVHATINCLNATVSEVEAAEAAIRDKMLHITTKPTLELSREHDVLMRNDEQGPHSLVSTFSRQVSDESTSIPQLEDDDQIGADEGKHSSLVPFRRRVSEKRKLRWNISFLFHCSGR